MFARVCESLFRFALLSLGLSQLVVDAWKHGRRCMENKVRLKLHIHIQLKALHDQDWQQVLPTGRNQWGGAAPDRNLVANLAALVDVTDDVDHASSL
jgi:hypothetical protein